MAANVVVPEMGEYGMELQFVRWLRKEGDSVSIGEPLFEVDTDKATVEVEAYAAGILSRLCVSAGETVQPRQVIGVILAAGEAVEAAEGKPATHALASADVQISSPLEDATRSSKDDRVRATPRARRLAQEHGFDLTQLMGSGSGGMIVQRDVEEALAAHLAASNSAESADTRARTAERTLRAWQEIPHFHLRLEVDVTETLRVLRPTVAICAAAAKALVRHPECNLEWREKSLVRRDRVDLGLLVATEQGLLLSTLARPDLLGVNEIEHAIRGLRERTRGGRLNPADLAPRSLTISNLGMFAVDGFDAVIPSPDVLVLAVGRSRTKPIWHGDAFSPRQVIELTLAVDHRALDGAEAARMLGTLEELLADPSHVS